MRAASRWLPIVLIGLLPACKNITIQSLGAPCGELVDAECGDSLSCVGATATSAGICRALCSANADCAGQGGVCFVNGVGENQSVCRIPSESSCSSDRDCPIGTVCRGGDGCLAACNVATDCGPSGFECRGNACYPTGGGGGPATITLYTGLAGATEILVRQHGSGAVAVYWIEQSGTALRRAIGEDIQTVATGTRLAQLQAEPGQPQHVYFVDGVNIRRVGVGNDGEAIVEDFATNQSILRLAIGGRPAAAWWTTNFDPGMQNEVRTLALGDPLGTPTVVPGSAETTGILGALTVDESGVVYWAVNVAGQRLRSTGGLDVALRFDVWDLAVSGGTPYFAAGGGDTAPFCSVGDGSVSCQTQAVEAGAAAAPPRLLLGTVGSNDLVLLAPNAGTVTRARVSGGAVDPQPIGTDQARPSSVSVHAGRVYWLNTGGDGGAIVAEPEAG